MPPLPDDEERSAGVLGWLHSVARSHVEVALKHPIKLIANALGSPPKDVIDQAHEAGVPVAALAGSAKHAQRHVDNGVDIVVAQGHEAGGHTGEIGSMVLWPEIVDALMAGLPVLAAGGIGTGRQVAAALALGAQGVWMGSAFLTSAEYDLGVRTEAGTSVIQQALLAATSSDTVRRRIYTGKPARLLKSRWTDAWDAPDAPEPLPMPLQNILVSEAHQRMSESTDPTRRRDAGRPDRRPDERDPAGRRHHRRVGPRVRGSDPQTGRHPGKLAPSLALSPFGKRCRLSTKRTFLQTKCDLSSRGGCKTCVSITAQNEMLVVDDR